MSFSYSQKLIALLCLFIIFFISCRSEENIIINTNSIEEPQKNEEIPEKEPQYSNNNNNLIVLGRCEYNAFHGKAIILNINSINPEEIIIEFDFILENENDKNNYRFPDFNKNSNFKKTLYISPESENSNILELELESGEKLNCIRMEIVKGTCTPVIFKFTDLEK